MSEKADFPIWIPFSYDENVGNSLPPPGEIVWINDEFYHGVTTGYSEGHSWYTTFGSDDISVTHWMKMNSPRAPEAPNA